MRVYVLGSSGMLGRYVTNYFVSKGFDVLAVDRSILDAANVNKTTLDILEASEGDIFINCIGVIKQRGDFSNYDFIMINSAFPYLLADYCEEKNIRFIHITTDCVFDGLHGRCLEHAEHTAVDIYGRSKSFGEPPNATVIRTSIIGEEIYNKKSLLEWVKYNKDSTVNGFTNHIWNGITCLQFAKVCEYIINNDLFWAGTRHVHSPEDINKSDLIQLISDVFSLNVKVIPIMTTTEPNRDMTLRSIYNSFGRGIIVPPLRDQLIELRNFSPILVDM